MKFSSTHRATRSLFKTNRIAIIVANVNISGLTLPCFNNGEFAGDLPGGADSSEFAVSMPKFMYSEEQWSIHFATEEQIAQFKSAFWGEIHQGMMRNLEKAGHILHSIEDAHGAHRDYIDNTFGHGVASATGHNPDVVIGDQTFIDVSNEIYQFLRKSDTVKLTNAEINELIDAIISKCAKHPNNPTLKVTRPSGGGGGGGGFGGGFFGSPFGWNWNIFDLLKLLYPAPEGEHLA